MTMSSNAAGAALTPIPIFWQESIVHAFVEIPVSGARFEAVELQRVEWEGKVGHIVVLHRVPGQLELYVEPSIDLDETTIAADPAFAHFEIAHFEWLDGSPLRCDIVGGELDAAASFTDATGATIEVRARHRARRRSRPLFTPAPPQSKPRNLRFLLLNQLRLLPGRRAEVTVTVDGAPVTPTTLLVPVSQARLAPYLESRSGAEMMLASLVPEHHHRPLPVAGLGRTELDDGSVAYVTEAGVRSIQLGNQHDSLSARFDPPLPRLVSDRGPLVGASGQLVIDSTLGEVATGRWQLTADGAGRARLELTGLTQDWFPGWTQPHRLVLQRLRSWRRRDQEWHYRAELEASDSTWYSTGGWI